VIKTDRETRTNETKKFVISPKVVEYAKKYFNCSTVSGVELEDSGGYDDYINSHWEARILLGEYMNSEVHTPEQAISVFTLALLEDSGWYKANYYTGGLMRFGKHQGCAFINEDCEVNDHSKNKFKNDLFVISNLQDIFKTTCTSGRQSRSYIISNSKLSRGNVQAGKEIADDCFVSDLNIDEEQSSYYVGSCNKGNGEYGKMIYYNNQYHENNGNIPENFGEKISNNSFCVLSSAVPLSLKNEDINKFNAYDGINHPMCYPMFCSSKSLTMQIYNQYIVCPREGGIIEIKGNYKVTNTVV
jgi:leishmanolysin-like peptidase